LYCFSAAFKQFKEDLENWSNQLVKLAVTGKSGVGKSSFINAIRNLKPGISGFHQVPLIQSERCIE
jgi:GTP-binding protein EngB required for normal cell division